jgi:threonine/homoserine/homoserine lactone efflux protein
LSLDQEAFSRLDGMKIFIIEFLIWNNNMDIKFWLVYVAVVFSASIIPGPSMLLALAHGIKYGYKNSIATALGNTIASIIQASIAVSGLSIILTSSDFLFEVIRFVEQSI